MIRILISILTIFIFSFFLASHPVQAQESARPKPQRVKLLVSSSDSNIESEVKSYISRELRSLNDIIIVDDDVDWFLSIIYLIIGITTFVFHTKGCKKCNIRGCPFGRK